MPTNNKVNNLSNKMSNKTNSDVMRNTQKNIITLMLSSLLMNCTPSQATPLVEDIKRKSSVVQQKEGTVYAVRMPAPPGYDSATITYLENSTLLRNLVGEKKTTLSIVLTKTKGDTASTITYQDADANNSLDAILVRDANKATPERQIQVGENEQRFYERMLRTVERALKDTNPLVEKIKQIITTSERSYIHRIRDGIGYNAHIKPMMGYGKMEIAYDDTPDQGRRIIVHLEKKIVGGVELVFLRDNDADGTLDGFYSGTGANRTKANENLNTDVIWNKNRTPSKENQALYDETMQWIESLSMIVPKFI